jgi:hypothetical protein
MKKNLWGTILFLSLSLLWLISFFFQLAHFSKINHELSTLSKSFKNIENLNFYKKSVENLQREFESASIQSFSTKSSSEFIAKLPKIGEFSGIKQMKVENAEVKKENGLEVTELKITTVSRFPDVANFIDILERSKLPIQISALSMDFRGGQLNTVMTIKIYKKVIED